MHHTATEVHVDFATFQIYTSREEYMLSEKSIR